jgi:hypothetical protein
MNEQPQTIAEQHIEHLMQVLDPSSERYQVLATAKRFKSSWVELGDRLIRVNTSKSFSDWGYSTFEEYCSREIRIKKHTADKLTLAYRFLQRQEPEVLEKHNELKPVPDYRTIDLLRQAKDERGFDDAKYAEFRKAVIEQERSHPTVLKQFKEMTVDSQEADKAQDPIKAKLALAAAKRLHKLLQEISGLPAGAEETVGELIEHLGQRVESEQIQEVQL